ncbi:MAG: hypothetical protein LKF36_03105 [Lactobacillus sp.]|jgi:uncharacterized membrane protein YczE|nr:hypothetical protein [Lactobacillus sp.]
MTSKQHRLTGTQSALYLIISITLNALGNGITVSLNLGSALWTASAVNLSHLVGGDLKLLLMIIGFIAIIVNMILLGGIQWRRAINNLVFMIPFSVLVGYSATMFNHWHLENLPLVLRIVLDLFGIVMIATAVSIYQRVNILLHPLDDFMQIIRFKFFKGNAPIAMWVSFIPPVTMSLIAILLSHRIYAINIGTIFSLLFQGSLVGWADRHVFKTLKHQGLDKLMTAKHS